MTAVPASHAARRISAPAPTQFSPCSRRTRPACRSRKWKWCLATLSFRTDRSRAVRWATASVVPAVFAAADNAINSLLHGRDDDAGIALRETQAG